MASVYLTAYDDVKNQNIPLGQGHELPMHVAETIYEVGSPITFIGDDAKEYQCKIVEVKLDTALDRVDLLLEFPDDLKQ